MIGITIMPDFPPCFFCREKREQELDYFMRKKYNRLGTKIQTRVDTLDSLKTDSDMLLK